MPRSRSLCRLVAAALCLVPLAACAHDPDADRPAPTVTTGEVEQRLRDHLTRLVASVFEADVTAPAPVLTRMPGCGESGPSWGVTPRAELTVTAGDKAEKYFDDASWWLGYSGFPAERDTSDDGLLLASEHARNSPSFKITLTGPCAWPPDRPDGPPASGRLAPMPPPARPATGNVPVEADVCGSPKLYVFNVDADPYAGAGPHPITVLKYGADRPGFLSRDFTLPDSWGDQHRTIASSRTKSTQLVACVRVETTTDTGRDVTCGYRSTDDLAFGGDSSPYVFDVFTSVYHVTMREARTGKTVGEVTIPGTLSDEQSCPYRMQTYLRPLALGLDEARLQRELRPFRESSR